MANMIVDVDGNYSANNAQNGVTVNNVNTNETHSLSSFSMEFKEAGVNGQLSKDAAAPLSSSSAKKVYLQPSASPSTNSFSVFDGDERINELKEQIDKLSQLLILKEKEWNAILLLKSHMEYVLVQIERTPKTTKIQDEVTGILSTTAIKDCMELIMSQKDAFILAEVQMKKNIGIIGKEKDKLKINFPINSRYGVDNLTPYSTTGGESKLSVNTERKRKTKKESPSTSSKMARPTISDPVKTSNASSNGNKNKVGIGMITLAMGSEYGYTNLLQQLVAKAAAQQKKNPTDDSTGVASATSLSTLATRALSPLNKPKSRKSTSPGWSSTVNSKSLHIPSIPIGSKTLAQVTSSTHSDGMSPIDITVNDMPVSQLFFGTSPTSHAVPPSPPANTEEILEVSIVPKNKQETVQMSDTNYAISPPWEDKICQGCKQRPATYVCAACSNQWYCSRICQTIAWAKHSRTCLG